MPKVLKLPKMGVNMVEATISEWVVKEGDQIKKGDHILNAETDKAVQEINSTKEGILAKIIAKRGDNVKIQDPIAILTDPGEELDEDFTV